MGTKTGAGGGLLQQQQRRRGLTRTSEAALRFAQRFLSDAQEKQQQQKDAKEREQQGFRKGLSPTQSSNASREENKDAHSFSSNSRIHTSSDATGTGCQKRVEESSPLQVMSNTDYGKYERLSKQLDDEEARAAKAQEEAAAASRAMLQGCSHDHSKERQIYEKPTREKIDAADRFRQEGNAAFRAKNYGLAAVNYRKALLQFDYTFPDTPEEQERMDSVKLPCHLNLAACKLHQQDYEEVYIECRLALEMDPDNVKARYRRGLAYLRQDYFDKAREDLMEAHARDPHSKEIRDAIQLLREKIQKYKQRSAKAYRAMLRQDNGVAEGRKTSTNREHEKCETSGVHAEEDAEENQLQQSQHKEQIRAAELAQQPPHKQPTKAAEAAEIDDRNNTAHSPPLEERLSSVPLAQEADRDHATATTPTRVATTSAAPAATPMAGTAPEAGRRASVADTEAAASDSSSTTGEKNRATSRETAGAVTAGAAVEGGLTSCGEDSRGDRHSAATAPPADSPCGITNSRVISRQRVCSSARFSCSSSSTMGSTGGSSVCGGSSSSNSGNKEEGKTKESEESSLKSPPSCVATVEGFTEMRSPVPGYPVGAVMTCSSTVPTLTTHSGGFFDDESEQTDGDARLHIRSSENEEYITHHHRRLERQHHERVKQQKQQQDSILKNQLLNGVLDEPMWFGKNHQQQTLQTQKNHRHNEKSGGAEVPDAAYGVTGQIPAPSCEAHYRTTKSSTVASPPLSGAAIEAAAGTGDTVAPAVTTAACRSSGVGRSTPAAGHAALVHPLKSGLVKGVGYKALGGAGNATVERNNEERTLKKQQQHHKHLIARRKLLQETEGYTSDSGIKSNNSGTRTKSTGAAMSSGAQSMLIIAVGLIGCAVGLLVGWGVGRSGGRERIMLISDVGSNSSNSMMYGAGSSSGEEDVIQAQWNSIEVDAKLGSTEKFTNGKLGDAENKTKGVYGDESVEKPAEEEQKNGAKGSAKQKQGRDNNEESVLRIVMHGGVAATYICVAAFIVVVLVMLFRGPHALPVRRASAVAWSSPIKRAMRGSSTCCFRCTTDRAGGDSNIGGGREDCKKRS